MDTLKKYADFAMYQVKHQQGASGRVRHGDLQPGSLGRTAETDFQQLLSEERVYYVFQPIFSARTGKVIAYEALMRSDMEALRSPATIMKLAREQGALYEIERLTFFQGAGDLRPPAQRGPCAQGHDALHQLHCKRLPAQRGQRVYGKPLA